MPWMHGIPQREWDGVLDRPPCYHCPMFYDFRDSAFNFSMLSQTAFAQAMINRRIYIDERRRVQERESRSDTT